MSKTAYISFVRPVNPDSISALLSTVNQVIANKCQNITLMISSEGGQLISGFAAYNQLQMLPINLTTYNIGSVNSIATIIFLAGTSRIAVPNATFLFHGTSWTFGHNGGISKRQIFESLSALDIDEQRMKEVIVNKTNLQLAEAEKLLVEGATKDTQFAQNANIIQEIISLKIPAGIPIIQV